MSGTDIRRITKSRKERTGFNLNEIIYVLKKIISIKLKLEEQIFTKVDIKEKNKEAKQI